MRLPREVDVFMTAICLGLSSISPDSYLTCAARRRYLPLTLFVSGFTLSSWGITFPFSVPS